MFVQHFKPQGRCFTNFHYYYYYYYSVLVWMKVIYFTPFTRILEWNKAYQCSFTKQKSFRQEFYILKLSVSQMKHQKCDFYSFKVCFSSLITNVKTMCGDFLWYVLMNQWCVHRKFLPRSSQNTNTNMVSHVSLCLCATNAFTNFTCGFNNFWFIITFSSFWRFWWYITGSKHIKDSKEHLFIMT